MRFGYVLGMEPQSGLARQVEQFRRGYGGRVSSGKQWQPWIHVADAASLTRFALEEPSVKDALNATAPDPLRNRDFTRALAEAVGKPARMMTPGFLLRMWLGVTADTILYGRRVIPRRALELGYPFQFPTLDSALRDLLQTSYTS
jgi:NAD dependent epimerase/dehydratase family enzyme